MDAAFAWLKIVDVEDPDVQSRHQDRDQIQDPEAAHLDDAIRDRRASLDQEASRSPNLALVPSLVRDPMENPSQNLDPLGKNINRNLGRAPVQNQWREAVPAV